MTYTLEQQVAAVRREIKLREQVYPRMVASARMKPEKSVYELGVMRAVLETLERLHEPATAAEGVDEEVAVAHG